MLGNRLVPLALPTWLCCLWLVGCSDDASLGHDDESSSEATSSGSGGTGATAGSETTGSGTHTSSGGVGVTSVGIVGTVNTSTGGTSSTGSSEGTTATTVTTVGTTGTGGGGSGGNGGSGGDATTITVTTGIAGSGGSPSCELESCTRPYECVEYCGAPILSAGCCPCEDGLIDAFVECRVECEAGDTKYDDCNTCTCADGLWACTKKACLCGGETCDSDEYCERGLGNCGGDGTCQPYADGCIQVVDPVCGCDGGDYSNPCEAARVGVSVASKGTCGGE